MCKSMEIPPFLQYLKQGILVTYNMFFPVDAVLFYDHAIIYTLCR